MFSFRKKRWQRDKDVTRKDWWDKIDVLGRVAIPVAVAAVGFIINASMRADDVALKQVENAIKANDSKIAEQKNDMDAKLKGIELLLQDRQRGQELDLKYVEIAVSILNTTPKDELLPLREWAIDVINRHSVVPLPNKAKALLLKHPLSATVSLQGVGMKPGAGSIHVETTKDATVTLQGATMHTQ